jgi:uncharacterized membrane protein (DUF373 family)
MRGRFGWTDTQYGIFNGISGIFGCFNVRIYNTRLYISLFQTLLIYPLCHKFFQIANSSLAIFGILSKITFLLMLVSTYTEWIVYFAALPMSFNRFVATSLRSIIGQLVYDEEQG